MHMVGMKTEFRGKGLGKYLNNVCVKKLAAQDVDYIYLTTDEWRKGAVKGVRARGNITFDISWENSALKTATATAENDCTLKIKLNEKTKNPVIHMMENRKLNMCII